MAHRKLGSITLPRVADYTLKWISAHPIVVLVRERGILVSEWPVIRQECQSGIGKAERLALLQLRVFRLRLLIDRNVWIRILPEGEEVFVGGEGAGAGQVRVGAS